MIWIIKNPKTVSTGIDSLGNKRVNYFNAIKYFVSNRQGTLEGNNGYIKRERSEIKTLILAGGRHVLCSTDIMEAKDQTNTPEKETTGEEDKFSAIYLLQTSDPVRYGNVNKEIQNGSYVGRDEYLTTSGGAYELIV